jgi:hypothetical protein
MAPLFLSGLLLTGIYRLSRASTAMALIELLTTHLPGLCTGPLSPRSLEYPR